jgi:hypothetical protein
MPFKVIAPQHGSIIKDQEDLKYIFRLLTSLQDVGIDGIVKDNYNFKFDNSDERFN